MPRLTTKDREESKDPKGESNKSKGSREVGDRVGRKPLTLLDAHKERWKDGCGAEICSRSRRVFSRGKIPCHVLLIGEAPGECITGDSLIETPFRDKIKYPDGIPIRQLEGKRGFRVYSYDLDNQRIAIGRARRVWKTGVNAVFKITYSWWGAPPDGKGGRQRYTESIRSTINHQFLLKTGMYLSIEEGLMVGDRLQPFYRSKGPYQFIGSHSTKMKKESILLMEEKLGRRLTKGEEVHHHDRNKWNDSSKNLILISQVEHARLHGYEDNAMFNPVHREMHRQVMESDEYRSNMSRKMKEVFRDPVAYEKRLKEIAGYKHKIAATLKDKYKNPMFYYNYLNNRRDRNGRALTEEEVQYKFENRFPGEEYPPVDNHEIISIEPDGEEEVYDMEVDKYHNFAANGVFVHNSENVLGVPFIGPAGKLLDRIVKEAIKDRTLCPKCISKGVYSLLYYDCLTDDRDFGEEKKLTCEPGHEVRISEGIEIRVAFTNMVCCLPRNDDGGKATKPDDDDVESCGDRLAEFVKIADPKLIVCVGEVARDWLDPQWKKSVKLHRPIPRISIIHPAAILRMNVSMQGLSYQRAVVTLSNGLEDMG